MAPKKGPEESLFDMVVSQVPAQFVRDFMSRIPNIYEAAHDSVTHDPLVDRHHRENLIGQTRHAYVQNEFQRSARAAGLSVTIERGDSGYPFWIARAGQIVLTACAAPAIAEMPRASDFRSELARFNRILESPRFPSMTPPGVYEPSPVFAVLHHVPVRITLPETYRRHPGFVGIGVPRGDMSGWHARFSLKQIAAAQAERRVAEDRQLPDNVKPKPRKKAEDNS